MRTAGRTQSWTVAWVGLLLGGVWPLSSVHAQDFSLPWWTVEGGGSQSTGAVFRVSSTIGQPDAGRIFILTAPQRARNRFYQLRKLKTQP